MTVFCWTMALTGTSVFFKIIILENLYWEDFLGLIDFLFDRHAVAIGHLLIPVIFARDFLECLLIVSFLYLLCRYLLRINFSNFMLFVMLLGVILAGVNYVSFRELRIGVTVSNIFATVGWAVVNPEVLSPYLTKRFLVVLAEALLWCGFPWILLAYLDAPDRKARRYFILAGLVWTIPLAFLFGAICLWDLKFGRQWWWVFVIILLPIFCASYLFHKRREAAGPPMPHAVLYGRLHCCY